MIQVAAPRPFNPGTVRPGDHHSRLAARRSFVALKHSFLEAVALVANEPGAHWLQAQVRTAEQPVDLWLLRAPVFAALAGGEPEWRERRHALRRDLDSVFPDLDPGSAFLPF